MVNIFYLVVWLTTCPQLIPNQVLHPLRSITSSFYVHYPLVSFRLSSSCLCLLFPHSVTFILPTIYPSVMCFRRRFLCKMWALKLAFLLLLYVRRFSPAWLYATLHFSHYHFNWSPVVKHILNRDIVVCCYNARGALGAGLKQAYTIQASIFVWLQ